MRAAFSIRRSSAFPISSMDGGFTLLKLLVGCPGRLTEALVGRVTPPGLRDEDVLAIPLVLRTPEGEDS